MKKTCQSSRLAAWQPGRLASSLPRCLAISLYWLLLLVLGTSFSAQGSESPNSGILFYASFNQSKKADMAAGRREPLTGEGELIAEGKFDGAVYLPTGATLTYDAPGNIYAERGTISFWWRLDEPPGRTYFNLLKISYAQHSTWDFTFAQISWSGSNFYVATRDRNVERYDAEASGLKSPDPGRPYGRPVPGRWYHIALTWDELSGINLFIDGKICAETLGPLHLDANLDQIGVHTPALSPHGTRGSQRKAAVDELRIYDRALTQEQITLLAQGKVPIIKEPFPPKPENYQTHWLSRYGWDDRYGQPRVFSGKVTIKKIAIVDGKDLGKFWVKGMDGKLETTWWPLMGHGYRDEGKALRIFLARTGEPGEKVNFITIKGNLVGRLYAVDAQKKRLLLARGEDAPFTTCLMLDEPLSVKELLLERTSGALSELSLYYISTDEKERAVSRYHYATPEAARKMKLLSTDEYASVGSALYWIKGRYSGAQHFVVGIPMGHLPTGAQSVKDRPGGLSFERQSVPHDEGKLWHIVLPAPGKDMAIEGLRVVFSEASFASGPCKVNIAVKDPLFPFRDLINVDLQLSGMLDLTLDTRDFMLSGEKPVIISVAAEKGLDLFRTSTELLLTKPEVAKRQYIPDRLLQIKDAFQMLSEARPWMRAWNEERRRVIRKRLKLLDELYALLEDVRRWEPEEPLAAGYSSWINPYEQPPEFEQPKPPSKDIPLWAFRQQYLLKQFAQVANWWIKERQIETGEMGGALGDDSDMIQNWPGLALMDVSPERLTESARRVMECCYARGLVKDGMNTHRTDPLHAYEAGINTVPLLALLDYGNPIIMERLMAAVRHYERLTGINPSGHRHFRSSLFSLTEVVEEGHYGRETQYSPLLMQAGLYWAWYNGSPETMRYLREYADGLLAHWQTEEYPHFARIIDFKTDKVLGTGSPGRTRGNLMWGLYDLTGDERYLYALKEAVKGPFFGQANSTTGRWLEIIGKDAVREALVSYARSGNIWDHNLQADHYTPLAKQHAWQVTGDKSFLLEYQAALVKHMSQNMYLYTEAHQYTDRIYIPTLATQKSRLGGIANYRSFLYPGHAVSWENTKGDIAALVPEGTKKHLKVVIYNLAQEPRKVTMRVWQLENGKYKIVTGIDSTGDDEMDTSLERRIFPLKRYSKVDLNLPPRKTVIVEINQIEKGVSIRKSCDLAVCPNDFAYDSDMDVGRIIIHNIGDAASGEVMVTIKDERGIALRQAWIRSLEAPLDLKPKTTAIEIYGIKSRGIRSLTVHIDPEGRVKEITRANNTTTIKIP